MDQPAVHSGGYYRPETEVLNCAHGDQHVARFHHLSGTQQTESKTLMLFFIIDDLDMHCTITA